MEPAWKQEYRGTTDKSYRPFEPEDQEPAREIPEWEIKLGKVIFYVTVAASIWFFYWLNGIQCPC